MRRAVVPLAAAIAFVAIHQLVPVEAGDSARRAYYANCDSARAAGAAPIHRGEPGYRGSLDRDDDGIACEPRREP